MPCWMNKLHLGNSTLLTVVGMHPFRTNLAKLNEDYVLPVYCGLKNIPETNIKIISTIHHPKLRLCCSTELILSISHYNNICPILGKKPYVNKIIQIMASL